MLVDTPSPSYILEHDPDLDRLSYRIRLADKYDVDDLLQNCLRKLRQLYPSTLKEWDSLGRDADSSRAITAVNLARFTRTDSVLPSALYGCMRLPESNLICGAFHSDGTTDVLGTDDLARCMRAKVMCASVLAAWIVESFCPQNCSSYEACGPIWSNLRQDTMLYIRRKGLHGAFLVRLDRIFNPDNPATGPLAHLASTLCVNCVERISIQIRQWRAANWWNLPRTLRIEIEGWED